MKISVDFIKNNSKKISERVCEEMKKHGMTNKQIAKILECNENTVGRKNKNKDGSFYNRDDLNRLSVAFGCSMEKLCIEEITLDNDFVEQNKRYLKRDYTCAINYLHTIGIHLEPGIFWVGSAAAFNNVYIDLLPFLTSNSIKYYKKHKKEIDNETYDDILLLSLKENPVPYMTDIENLKLKKIDDTISSFAPFCLDPNTPFKKAIQQSEKTGTIRLYYYVINENNPDKLSTISVLDINKLFEYMDTITRTSVNALLNNSINSYYTRE